LLFRLPKAKKEAIISPLSTPGPSHYKDQSPRTKRHNPSYRISIKTESEFEKFLRKEERPGPASYNPFRTSISNIKYTMPCKNDRDEILSRNLTKKMRKSIASLRMRPGPADYNASNAITSTF